VREAEYAEREAALREAGLRGRPVDLECEFDRWAAGVTSVGGAAMRAGVNARLICACRGLARSADLPPLLSP
jgi:hypothetical protein